MNIGAVKAVALVYLSAIVGGFLFSWIAHTFTAVQIGLGLAVVMLAIFTVLLYRIYDAQDQYRRGIDNRSK